MPATVEIKRIVGASGSQTLEQIDGFTTNLNTADTAFDGTANPTRIPAAGTNYSFFASTRLVCVVAPDVQINNLGWYTDGSNGLGTGIGLNVSTVASGNGDTTTTYTRATGTAGVTGLEMGANYGHSISSPVNAFTFTVSSVLSVPGDFITGIDTPGDSPAGSFGDWVILQLTVGTSASPALTPTETITWVWDEI